MSGGKWNMRKPLYLPLFCCEWKRIQIILSKKMSNFVDTQISCSFPLGLLSCPWNYNSDVFIITFLFWDHWLAGRIFLMVQFTSLQFSRSVVSDSATPWITEWQDSLSITNSQSLLKLMSIELVMPSSHVILCCPLLLLPQSFPASGSFPMSQLFAWGGDVLEF